MANTKALRLREAADALGVSEGTIRTWIAAGEIPATKIGGLWIISSDTIDRLLAAGDEA